MVACCVPLLTIQVMYTNTSTYSCALTMPKTVILHTTVHTYLQAGEARVVRDGQQYADTAQVVWMCSAAAAVQQRQRSNSSVVRQYIAHATTTIANCCKQHALTIDHAYPTAACVVLNIPQLHWHSLV